MSRSRRANLQKKHKTTQQSKCYCLQGCGKEPSLVALFTFVARHPLTQKSTQLNTLKPHTSEEKLLFEERQKVADSRRAARSASASAQQQGLVPGSIWVMHLCCLHVMKDL